MKLFADTRTKRHTAFVMLLVWLFALASSIANACMLETREPHAPTASQSQAATIQVLAEGLAPHDDADAGHHDHPDGTTKDSCLKVCDDGTHALPKAYSGVDHNDPGPAPLVVTLWTASQRVVSAHRRLDDSAMPIVGPPFRVRYSRLAL